MACIAKRRGKYVVDFYDNKGKRRWKTLPKGTTKSKARRALREIEEKIDKGIYIAPKKLPYFSVVAEMWLQAKKPNIRHSTYSQYAGHLEKHLKPFLGDIKINRINYDSIEKFISHSLEHGVSIPTLRKILINLGAILTYACRKRYLDYNPVRDIEKPKGHSEHDKNEDLNILTPKEIRTLLNFTEELKYNTLFMTAVMTGMRQGELLGLKWSDFDWFNNQVYVNRTYNHFCFYEPKTKTSKRKIDLAPQLVAQLKKWKLACPPSELDLVFPNEKRKPMSALNMYNRKFLPALKKAGLKKIRFHDLRHTYASIQIDLGANSKYLQKQMGHSSIKITLDVYGHLMKDVNKEAANRLGKAIFSESSSNMVARK